MKHPCLCSVALCLILAGTVVTFAGCPQLDPIPTTFKIKLINTGEFPLVGAYMLAREDRIGLDPTAENWGANMIPAQLDKGLDYRQYLLLEGPFQGGEYYLRVDFLIEEGVKDGELITFYLYPKTVDDDIFVTSPSNEDYVTWHGHRTVSATGSSIGTGWSWGLSTYEGEQNMGS